MARNVALQNLAKTRTLPGLSTNEPSSDADSLAAFATGPLKIPLDPIQLKLLTENPKRAILNCCRQWGKSTVTAAKAVYTAVSKPKSLITVLSPSARQSGEFIRKAADFLRVLNLPVRGDGDNEISLLFPNQSRIVGLPGKDSTIRGFSAVSLLLIDEASRVPDDLYRAVRPMLATSDGDLWLISTPFGRSGFFYETWARQEPPWHRVQVPATDCPRIAPNFLEEERRSMPLHIFRQEYLCEFVDSEDSVFAASTIERALIDIPPLVFEGPMRHRPEVLKPHYFVGVDLGQANDPTVISIIERGLIRTGERDFATWEFPTRVSYAIRYLERIPLDTTYRDIANRLRELVVHPAIKADRTIIVDATGMGRPIVELIRGVLSQTDTYCRIVPVTITGGAKPTVDGIMHNVPRNHLLTNLELAFQNSALDISQHLPLAPTLLAELQNLKREDGHIVSAKTTIHDDFVFATALAYYHATANPPSGELRINPREHNHFGNKPLTGYW